MNHWTICVSVLNIAADSEGGAEMLEETGCVGYLSLRGFLCSAHAGLAGVKLSLKLSRARSISRSWHLFAVRVVGRYVPEVLICVAVAGKA